MGRGSYQASDWAKLRASRGITSTSSASSIFTSTKAKDAYLPKFIDVRESRDSEDSPNSTPIILGFDVTGSMGYLAEEIAKNALNETVTNIYAKNPVTNPHIMCAAFVEAEDRDGLQVTQFESDIRIAEQLLDLWLEEHGNGDVVPCLLWYFAAKHTLLDNYQKRGKKGFLFTIGDDAECRTDMRQLATTYNRVIGDTVSASVEDVLKETTKKFEVFHLFLDAGGHKAQSIVNLLPGHTMVIAPDEIDAIPEILISTMQMVSGKTIPEVLAQWPVIRRPIVEKALRDLKIEDPKKGLVF